MYTSESDIVSAIEGLADTRYGDHGCEHLKALLLSYDGNGDGALSHDELANLLGDAGSCGFLGCGYFANKILDKLDKDSSGGITWDEYLAVSSSCVPAPGSTPAAGPAGSGGSPTPSGAAPGGKYSGFQTLQNQTGIGGALEEVKNSNPTTTPADLGLSTGAKVAIGAGTVGLLYLLLK